MPHRHPRDSTIGGRLTSAFMMASSALLIACWALGGVTVDSSGADEVLQLLALPIVLWAGWRLMQYPMSSAVRLSLLAAAVIVLVPLWQLLPLPQALGMGGTARTALAVDLAKAGVTHGSAQASLWPRATEQALWSMLPAIALFLAALTLAAKWRHRLLQLVLGLVLASAAFAFFQLSLPDRSPLLLYSSWGRNFGGLFVNPNHQGSALILGALIATALYIDGRRRANDDGGYFHWLYGLLAAGCVAMVPLANGSAAILLLLVGLVAVALLMGTLRRSATHGKPAFILRVAAAGVAVVVVAGSALTWQRADTERQQIATTALQIGSRFAPLGTGVGSFVPVFAQSQSPIQTRTELVNHAHNEYAQWWLEGGVPAVLALGFGLGVFAFSGWQVLTRIHSSRLLAVAAPAWAGLLILLLHSLVDFPMRTTALMATAGLLAGLLLATLADAREDNRRRVHHDDAVQQA